MIPAASRQILVLVVVLASCGGARDARAPGETPEPSGWHSDNWQRLDAFVARHRWRSGDPAPAPVAIFDWDNTVIKNDVGHELFYWMLRHDKILQPPERDWRRVSQYLTEPAARALNQACDGAAEPGAALPTSRVAACAAELAHIKSHGETAAGEAAFAGFHHRRFKPTAAWVAALLAGYRPAQVREFTDQAIDEALKQPIGATMTIAGMSLPAYVRIYAEISDAIGLLREHGFDVWVLSASPQPVVEAFASRLQIPADHVVGIRSVLVDGVSSYDLEGCGPVADGDNSLITFNEGKRCWMNKVIFGVAGAEAIEPTQDPGKRPRFAAGDSVTDSAFLRDVVGLRLAINRNQAELMCHAYANRDGGWLVNPMFIDPKPARAEDYRCSTDACVSPTGQGMPCLDTDGAALLDQADRVAP